MNKEICKKVLEYRERFIPRLFTARQIELLEKYLQQKDLTKTEKSYVYSTLKQKIETLSLLREEFYVTGEQMIPERIEKAKEILKELGYEKAFISGSFLYKKDYRDADVFIITKKRNSYHQKDLHLNFITEKILKHPIYISSLRYSVANFYPGKITPQWKRPLFDSIILVYEMVINEILNRDEERTLRELLFMHYFFVKNVILNSYSLYEKSEEIIKKGQNEKIAGINHLMKELILHIFTKRYLYFYLSQFVKQLKKDYSQEPYDNYPIFIDLFTEVKNECRIA